MSDSKQEPTLAERLREMERLADVHESAMGEWIKLEGTLPERYRNNAKGRSDYLTGHDDATREAEARIAALEAWVWELVSYGAFVYHDKPHQFWNAMRRAAEFIGDADAASVFNRYYETPEAQQPPAAVGVVGDVPPILGWAVLNPQHNVVVYGPSQKDRCVAFAEDFVNRCQVGVPHVVALVDPDSIVPLEGKGPVAWQNDCENLKELTYDRATAAAWSRTTVTPLYAGQPQPAQEET